MKFLNPLFKSFFKVTFPLLFIYGCASLSPIISEIESGNRNLTAANIIKIEKGKTTTDEIQQIFGEPDLRFENPKTLNTSWVYNYSKTKKRNLDRAPFALEQTQLEITFNQDNIVTEFTHTVSNKMKKN